MNESQDCHESRRIARADRWASRLAAALALLI